MKLFNPSIPIRVSSIAVGLAVLAAIIGTGVFVAIAIPNVLTDQYVVQADMHLVVDRLIADYELDQFYSAKKTLTDFISSLNDKYSARFPDSCIKLVVTTFSAKPIVFESLPNDFEEKPNGTPSIVTLNATVYFNKNYTYTKDEIRSALINYTQMIYLVDIYGGSSGALGIIDLDKSIFTDTYRTTLTVDDAKKQQDCDTDDTEINVVTAPGPLISANQTNPTPTITISPCQSFVQSYMSITFERTLANNERSVFNSSSSTLQQLDTDLQTRIISRFGDLFVKLDILLFSDTPILITNTGRIEIPKPGPNDVLIKTIACGVCHTDLHFIRGDWEIFQQFLPRIPGHEGIGEVIEIGSNVDACIKKGDILGIPWIHETCLQCEYCLSNREEVCPKLIRSGVTVDGCFAEYVLMNANFAIKLPDGMDPYTSAPIYCAGVTMYKALKTSKVQPGQWVSIVGIGGLGSIGIKYAIAMGMKVLAVVAPDDKVAVQLAKDMGAEEVYDGPAEKHGEWIQNKVGGVEASIVTVPLIIAFDQAFVSVKRCGRVIGVGIPKESYSLVH
ncbi:unnamed protein product [Adineta steineri]|uniref:Uncharacterized protein n=1 Tax=Adineta steineri TaxID=433720 RepID=A0A815G387_9BILA|nr:unnamed protein product [Adineta steineri]